MTAVQKAKQGKIKDYKTHADGQYSTHKVLAENGWQVRVTTPEGTFTLDQLALKPGVSRATIQQRIAKGYGLERLLCSYEDMARLINLEKARAAQAARDVAKPNGHQYQAQKDHLTKSNCQLAMQCLSKMPTRQQLTEGIKA